MTVDVNKGKSKHAGNGVATVFAPGFRVLDKAHLKVWHIDSAGAKTLLTVDVNYSLANVGTSSDVTVTYPLAGAALPTGESLLTRREMPFVHTRDYENTGGLQPKAVGDGMDTAAMERQQLLEKLSRALTGPPEDDADMAALPAKAVRAGKVLGFDPTTGAPVMSTETLADIEGAKTHADAAALAQAAAETAQTAAEAALDAFDDIFLGAKASDPATDNDGDPLAAGLLYWNTSTNVMRIYNGGAWQDATGGDASYIEPALLGYRCTNTYAQPGGFDTYTLTAVDAPKTGWSGALYDGLRVSFTPAETATGGATQISFTDLTGGAKLLYMPDTVTLASFFGIRKGVPVTVQYVAARDCYVLVTSSIGFDQALFPHGTAKLQSDGATSISLTQEDGKGLLLWNPTIEAFRPHMFAVVTEANVFANQNYVEGVANQALANNQMYAVYLHDTGGADGIVLDFWREYTGPGAHAWGPIVNQLGFYVKPTTAGGSTPDNTRTYVGMVMTGTGSVATTLTGAAITQVVMSHHKVWRFPVQTDQVNTNSSATAHGAWRTLPSPTFEFVTEGITDTGLILGIVNFALPGAGIIYARLKMTLTQFDGQTQVLYGQQMASYRSAGGEWDCMTLYGGSAIPWCHCKVEIEINHTASGGSGNASIDAAIAGYIAW